MFDSYKKFMKAVRADDYETVKYYVETYYYRPQKLNLDTRDEAGMTALHHVAKAGNLKMLRLMTRFGLDMNMPDKSGLSPLRSAIKAKKSAAAVMLIEAGVDVNAHDGDYANALHTAAYEGDIDVTKALVSAGARLDDIITPNGYTALHWAAAQGHVNVVEFLVQSGARQDIPNKAGKTARDMAEAKGAHIVKILDTPPVAVAAPAAAEAPAAIETPAYAGNDKWLRTGEQHVTHISEIPDINRRLTEIFNFETRERTVIHENLNTGAETVAPPESFDRVSEAALRRAIEAFEKLGGKLDETQILGSRKPAQRPFLP